MANITIKNITNEKATITVASKVGVGCQEVLTMEAILNQGEARQITLDTSKSLLLKERMKL